MKITNEMLAQYLANKELIRELEEANSVIVMGIKHNGGASTKDYVAVVEARERQTVASKKAFDEKMGPGWLDKQGLLNTSQYDQVVVTEKREQKSS